MATRFCKLPFKITVHMGTIKDKKDMLFELSLWSKSGFKDFAVAVDV